MPPPPFLLHSLMLPGATPGEAICLGFTSHFQFLFQAACSDLWWTVQLIAAIVPHFPGDPVWSNLRSGPANAIRMTGRTVSSGPRPSSWILGTEKNIICDRNTRACLTRHTLCRQVVNDFLNYPKPAFLAWRVLWVWTTRQDYFWHVRQLISILCRILTFRHQHWADCTKNREASQDPDVSSAVVWSVRPIRSGTLFDAFHFKHCKERGNASETSFFWRRQRSTMFWPWL